MRKRSAFFGKRALVAVTVFLAAILAGEAQGQGEPTLLGYTTDELVEFYVELALKEEVKIGEVGVLAKWPPDVSVTVIPDPSGTLVNFYGYDPFIEETKHAADPLASMVAHPEIVTLDRAAWEEFAQRARLDFTGAIFDNSIAVFFAPRLELVAGIAELERLNPGVVPPAVLAGLPSLAEALCLVVATAQPANPRYISRAYVYIELSDRFRACLFEEIMQSFGLPNDFVDGTPSIFSDDNVYSEPTVLDWLMWRVHADPRLEAGMNEEQVRPIARQVIAELLADE